MNNQFCKGWFQNVRVESRIRIDSKCSHSKSFECVSFEIVCLSTPIASRRMILIFIVFVLRSISIAFGKRGPYQSHSRCQITVLVWRDPYQPHSGCWVLISPQSHSRQIMRLSIAFKMPDCRLAVTVRSISFAFGMRGLDISTISSHSVIRTTVGSAFFSLAWCVDTRRIGTATKSRILTPASCCVFADNVALLG